MRKWKDHKWIFVLIILVLLVVFVYSIIRVAQHALFKETQSQPISSKTITRDGVDYFPRQDIDVILLMGIDKEGPVQSSGSYNNDGEADTVMLAVFDQTDESITIVNLNRDTMVEMPVLGVGGKQAGTIFGQLALSHTYGSGLKDSCENVKQTVSSLLYGVQIDHYIAMNMSAVALLNDAVGGVKVTVTDDFSEAGSDIPLGETVLRGQQAIEYIRLRRDVGDQLNLSRMERQNAYMESFLSAFKAEADRSTGFVVDTYDQISEYVVTDCSVNEIDSLVDRYGEYPLKEIISPAGTNRVGDPYMEFYLDEQAMDDLILDLLYDPK